MSGKMIDVGGMNSRMRKILYPKIVAMDGEHCKKCNVRPPEKKLVIDHKDNDDRHNELENLQFLCYSCNYKKNPRKRNSPHEPFDKCVDVCDERPMTPEMTENRRMFPLFKNWLFRKLMTKGSILKKDAINSGAEYVNGSTETIRRYIDRLTSEEGSFIIMRDRYGYPCIQFRE